MISFTLLSVIAHHQRKIFIVNALFPCVSARVEVVAPDDALVGVLALVKVRVIRESDRTAASEM
jgi:hypothetical protein